MCGLRATAHQITENSFALRMSWILAIAILNIVAYTEERADVVVGWTLRCCLLVNFEGNLYVVLRDHYSWRDGDVALRMPLRIQR